MQLDKFRLVGTADDEREAFGRLVQDIDYVPGAILYSEMLFMKAGMSQFEPLRVIEAGRGAGVSTEILARCFPDMPIISVERDAKAPGAEAAKARLGTYTDVDCRFGDPSEVLLEIAKPGDIALIGDPGGFAGLKLMLKLLATRKFDLAFLHGIRPDTPERAFLNKHLPETCFSDDPDFAEVVHELDAKAKSSLPADSQYESTRGKFGYGLSLACLPYDARLNYNSLARKAGTQALKKGIGRLFGGK
ncbi:MAG: hypothetical protein ACI8X5_003316 [Planctomycetota bacterium]|jgi:hypothetical protein